MNALHCFLKTRLDFGMLVLRIGMGAAMLPFGLMKLGIIQTPGMPGGIDATVGMFGSMGLPALIAYLVIIAESLGAVSLILGFCTRFCAASLSIIMIGAIVILFGKGYAMGYAMPLLFLIGYIPLIVNGGGAYAMDGCIACKCCPGCANGECVKK